MKSFLDDVVVTNLGHIKVAKKLDNDILRNVLRAKDKKPPVRSTKPKLVQHATCSGAKEKNYVDRE